MLANYVGGSINLVALLLYAYFCPAIIAFCRGHHRFWLILLANVLILPVQVSLAWRFFPGWLQFAGMGPLNALAMVAAIYLGPGWLAVMAWASATPAKPKAWMLAAHESKYFDLFMALPLILWFGTGALALRPTLVEEGNDILAGTATAFIYLRFFALAAAAGFNLLLVYLLVVRDKPVKRSNGLAPRFFGFAGTFLGVAILHLPVASLSFPMQALAAALVGIGSLGSLLVLARLGKAFSIMPEARRLVTGGPYSYARHPLYAVEAFTLIGTAIQFAQPWAGVLAAAVIVLQVTRSLHEERVLVAAYPEYVAYRARTKRFIPGII